MLTIRPETKEDYLEIREVNVLAFEGEAEATLIEKLRLSDAYIPKLSLVAQENGRIVGHILFSRITIEDGDKSYPALALAPMAVRPEFQNQGIGSQLVIKGLEKCKELGYRLVIVLGHPEFYPRFGFEPARKHGIEPPQPWPDEAFMVYKLADDETEKITGEVKYSKLFDEVT